ncbi:MAG: hypothetical protein DRH51_07260 [Candidatus Coatesbacteria bacterium]|nr:MAG: hypothetical protein DRH51_07260 [Candidatus Coatesbacteria bacterium]RLC41163.1 MAG: hypothetical protein DRH49_05900 [Candidatus Coatesbacteria bacterium]
MVTYEDNTGDSIENAIVIKGASGSLEGVSAEYDYLSKKFGECDKDWHLEKQSLIIEEDRFYDRMDIVLTDGSKKSIFFDISDFYGKKLGD